MKNEVTHISPAATLAACTLLRLEPGVGVEHVAWQYADVTEPLRPCGATAEGVERHKSIQTLAPCAQLRLQHRLLPVPLALVSACFVPDVSPQLRAPGRVRAHQQHAGIHQALCSEVLANN